jgi:2-keto-4-pentenoate hydratase/2-oxohepta-3-ene-1,7-dioic acid hydratase in catechol pathway
MPIPVLRTADTRWVEDPHRAPSPARRHGRQDDRGLMADRAAVDKAALELAGSAGPVGPPTASTWLSSVTTPCRLVAQMVNYRSHAVDAGFDPDAVQTTFFRKASGSVVGPYDTVVRPAQVRLLDCEVRRGLVIGGPVPVGTEITQTGLSDYVAGVVVADDVSARDVRLLKGSSTRASPTPRSPAGAAAALREREDVGSRERYRYGCGSTTSSGRTRYSATCSRPARPRADSAGPLPALQPGDVLLTGTPRGTV